MVVVEGTVMVFYGHGNIPLVSLSYFLWI
jgi:hypothetical protein